MSAVLTGSLEWCEISQCGRLPAGRCRLLQPICQHLHPRAVHLALALSFLLISVYLVFLYLSCFFPPFTHNLTPSLHPASLNLSLSHHRFMSSFFFRVIALLVLPSPFLSVHSLLEQTYEKSWQLSQRSFHKQHKASDNWSGCVAAGLSEGLALWVSNCSGSLAELRALHKLSVIWCRSQMACLCVRVCTRRKKKDEREMENMWEREKQKETKNCEENKGWNDTLQYMPCCNCRVSIAGLTKVSALLSLIKTSV